MPFRVDTASPMPDLAPGVVKQNALLDRLSRWGAVRAMLGVVAVQIIGFALPPLLLGTEQGTPAHDLRHLGAFSVAYAVGLLMVVARPARARTMLPVAAVLAAALVITAVADVLEGRVPLLGETGHLSEVLSVPLVWLLATPGHGRPGKGAQAPSSTRKTLRLVEDDDAGRDEGTAHR